MTQVAENIAAIKAQITQAARECGRRAEDVKLVAVSKKQPGERIAAALDAGHRLFGENRVQEAEERWRKLKALYAEGSPPNPPVNGGEIRLHLIGPLQTNKVKDAVALFDCIETVDREALAEKLAAEMEKQGRRIPCFVQVNSGAEEQKAGVLPEDLPALLDVCGRLGLPITGLMCIPPLDEPPAMHFALLKKLAARHGLSDLSMGMSADFEKAIALGATYVRIGTGVFGARE